MNEPLVIRQLKGFLSEDARWLPVLSNASALLMESFAGLNWAGFYLMRDGILVLGPFQGRPACIHIAPGRGVCGTAVKEDRILNVPDVHAFPGHIACDSASNSELVIPLHDRGGNVLGVMDLDSPQLSRFSPEDEALLAQFASVLESGTLWESGGFSSGTDSSV